MAAAAAAAAARRLQTRSSAAVVARSLALSTAAGAGAGAAPVYVSLVVERNALVVPPMSPLERQYAAYQQNLEVERSKPFVDDFFTKKTDSKLAAAAGVDAEQTSSEDKVVAADLVTDADRSGDKTTLQRGQWTFPQTRPDRSSPLLTREAEHFVNANFAGRVTPKLFFAGHSPAAVYEPATEPSAAVFFFRAQLLAGELKNGTAASGYAWLTREELADVFSSTYFEAVSPVLSH